MSTMRDVARVAGVSAKTVSRVMNNDRYVSDDVRTRVLQAVAFMGIGGDSLLQYLGHILSFWENRRILHFRRIGYKYDPKQLKKPGRKGKKKEAGKA